MEKPELLAPAGNLEKLKIAVLYGADAVYCGGFNYGLRAGADNFSRSELKEGTEYAHQHGARIYITVNMMPHNEDLVGLPEFLRELVDIEVDGLIISDPGVLRVIREHNIDLPLHLSTQANTVNWQSALFWQEQGLERIILARELSWQEIKEIQEKTDLELEIFIHGAMCVSYSGRCLLSSYMVGRDPNRGECAHSCRWKYHLMEEERPGQYYPIYEEEGGTYILNSRDLCLVEQMPLIAECGVDSLKIEGRMKGLHYTAVVTGVYRQLLDDYYDHPEEFEFSPSFKEELNKISHRPYTEGFFTGREDETTEFQASSSYLRSYIFVGLVQEYDSENKEAVIEVRNKINRGDVLEIMGPKREKFFTEVDYIINSEGEKIDSAPHPRELVKIPLPVRAEPYSIVRKKRDIDANKN